MLNLILSRFDSPGLRGDAEELAPIEPAAAEPAADECGPDSARVGRLLTARAQNLLRHVARAGEVLDHSVAELDQRSATLRVALGRAETRMQEGLASAAALDEEIAIGVDSTGERITTGLEHIQKTLDDKLGNTVDILTVIESIAGELNLLAVNAAIEAAHAKGQGATFAVVADRIRELAVSTKSNAALIKDHMDFSALRADLTEFETETVASLQGLSQRCSASTQRQLENFRSVHGEFDEIRENNGVIFEALDLNKGATHRILEKTRWVDGLLTDGIRVLSPEHPAHETESLLERHLINADPAYDRLEDIRRRGVLRVAIEPSFKGLSFRTRPNQPLQGLDVEYAKAFADQLKVRCEFVEHPWDLCTELLGVGPQPGEREVDLVWSALPPDASYEGVAFSNSYTYLPYVLARRKGDTRIQSLKDLEGRVLGCINDPAAFATLEAAGLRWGANTANGVRLANLLSYTDQSRIHDCLADGVVDAFAVDQPIYWWACYGEDSPWRGRLEILPGSLSPSPWYYAVGVAAEAASYHLLEAVNRFIAWFSSRPERRQIEQRWQGSVVQGSASYRDEPGNLMGEAELRGLFEARTAECESAPTPGTAYGAGGQTRP